MNMTTMRMYCPSLKENVEATITDGKQVASKGGSLRNIIYGEFEGRKCLPKTVKADVFAQHGFAAETFAVDVIHRKDGIEVGDNSMANEYQCGECDSVYDNSSDATICCKCPSCDEPIHEGDCIKYAETFNSYKVAPALSSYSKDELISSKAGPQGSASYDEMVYDPIAQDRLSAEEYNETFNADEPKAIILYDIVWKTNKDLPEGVYISAYDEEALEGHRDEDIQDYLYERFNDYAHSYKLQLEGGNYTPDAFADMKRFPEKYDAETFEAESSPSSFDISWEDAQGVSSPSLPPEGIHFAEEGDYRMNGEGCEYCAETRELTAEGFCSECASHAESFSASSYEDAFFTETVSEMAAEGISRNGKLALSLTALGIGVAMALGSDTVSSLLDKITRK